MLSLNHQTVGEAIGHEMILAVLFASQDNIDSEALTEINRLPLQTKAANWTARARSYVMARNALDRVETAALIEPMDDAPATPPAN